MEDLEQTRKELENNYERNIYFNHEKINNKDKIRYQFALDKIKIKEPKILEIGSGSGYGFKLLKKLGDINYKGIDIDNKVIDFANKEYGNYFEVADINSYNFEHYDVIIAFEVIEHLINGKEIVEKLKNHCTQLLISVPYNEPKGYWGEHHLIHNLTEKDFKNFEHQIIDNKYYNDEYDKTLLLEWNKNV